jgi:hypothetical protein
MRFFAAFKAERYSTSSGSAFAFYIQCSHWRLEDVRAVPPWAPAHALVPINERVQHEPVFRNSGGVSSARVWQECV